MHAGKYYYDEIFHYNGEWDMPSCCGLRIIVGDKCTTVIVTELYQDNPGSSVASSGRSLAEQICDAKGIDFDDMRYIECNPDMHSKLSFYKETCYEVHFYDDKPSVYRLLNEQETDELFKP